MLEETIVNSGDAEAAGIIAASDDSIYFADMIVRDQPIFHLENLSDLSARQRATNINRRITSLLERTDGNITVTAAPAEHNVWINLQANNRVLMTVTTQDTQDFGLSIEALAQDWAEWLEKA